MGLLDALSGGLTAATEAASGQQKGELAGSQILQKLRMQMIDQQEKQALTQQATARAGLFAHQANEPKLNYDANRGGVVNLDKNSFEPTPGLPDKPIPPKRSQTQYIDRWDGPVTMDEEGKYYDSKGMPVQGGQMKHYTPPPTNVFMPGVGEDGKTPTTFVGKSKGAAQLQSTGVARPKAGAAGGVLSGPIAAKVGQFGEMLKKTHDLLDATEGIDVGLGNSAAQDVAAHGVRVLGHSLPGTQGLGSMAVNRTPQYAKYQAALTPLVLATAHALSGARINPEQVEQIRASIEIKPGESKESRAQKLKNLMDLTNSIGGSLPPDAVATQEGQMEPQQIAKLRSHGYRGGQQHAQQGAAPSGAPASHAQQLWDAAVAKHGQAKVEQEYGPRPQE